MFGIKLYWNNFLDICVYFIENKNILDIILFIYKYFNNLINIVLYLIRLKPIKKI